MRKMASDEAMPVERLDTIDQAWLMRETKPSAMQDLRFALIRFATEFLRQSVTGADPQLQERVETADTLSTRLEWMSRRKEFDEVTREQFRFIAARVCALGIDEGDLLSEEIGCRMLCQLQLTAARLQLSKQEYQLARSHISSAELHASKIADETLKAQIDHDIAVLRRSFGIVRSIGWGMKSLPKSLPKAAKLMRVAIRA